MVFVAKNQAPEVLKPGKQPFDFPSARIATKLSAVLGELFAPLFLMRSNHFNATIIQKPLIKSIAVIGLIAKNAIRGILRKLLSMVASTNFTSWGEALSM